MKSVVVLCAALLAAAPVLAQDSQAKEVLTCSVPVQNGTSQVTLNVTVQSDTSADFVVVGLNDKGTVSRMFMQAEKDTVANGLQNGSLGFLLLEENFTSEGGVIRNAGFAIFSKGQTGAFTGLLSAKGNLYPLSCTTK